MTRMTPTGVSVLNDAIHEQLAAAAEYERHPGTDALLKAGRSHAYREGFHDGIVWTVEAAGVAFLVALMVFAAVRWLA